MSALSAQSRAEVVLTARRGESLLLVLLIPLVLLGFFSMVDVLPKGNFKDPVDFLVPGILALAIMSTSMVQVSIGTAFERQYGVLKRLGATPLGRPRLLGAKTIAVVAIELVQAVLIVGLGLVLGWSPTFEIGVVAAVVLGTIAFTGIGLLMAGTLRGEVTLAAANGAYLVLLLMGGMVVPLQELPSGLRTIAELLPSGALTQALVGTLTAGRSVPAHAWIVLAVWAVVTPTLAARFFKWE